MRLALIPPRGYERYALHSDFHLMLAQIETRQYIELYKDARVDRHYIIMDNGAAEGETVSDFVLMQRARLTKVDEVVLPDAIGDYEGTIARINQFFRNYDESPFPLDVKFMGVVQGDTIPHLLACLKNLIADDRVHVIGIPRHLIGKFGLVIRLELAKTVGAAKPIHLLGTNPHWPDEIGYIQREYPELIRSCDTSMPFNYAIQDMPLYPGVAPVSRPENYFGRIYSIDHSLLNRNIHTVLEWSRGKKTPVSEV